MTKMKVTRTNGLLVLVAMMAICLSSTSVMAQRGGGGRPGGGFGGFGGGGGVLDLANRKDVQEHLELLPDQVEDLEKLAEDERAGQRERMQGLFSGFDRNASEEERNAAREKIQEVLRKSAAETQTKVDKILLPHQSKRLSQLGMQRRLRGGVSNVFGNEDLASQIGISDAQRETLQSKAQEAAGEFRKNVAKLQAEMQADLLKSLSPAQKAKYDELIGEPFEFAADERPAFGQGGPGGRPGQGRTGGRTGGRTRGQRPTQ